ncbi:unnamed protein product [Bursaphelenchus xylophilus]|uniref:(pine wood nematode) hypothetical protein n=1 Tax=Bursaphelenchus xylophilus TaxID=6326 RepID=A0A1I7S2S5_BURXY|nr:unnamed protein product [Bursaphelenchus xylophilus]CAG9121664.1 unnamed protein product [Bursaphelenchus xylophilus]
MPNLHNGFGYKSHKNTLFFIILSLVFGANKLSLSLTGRLPKPLPISSRLSTAKSSCHCSLVIWGAWPDVNRISKYATIPEVWLFRKCPDASRSDRPWCC